VREEKALWREKTLDDVCRLRTGNRYKLGGFKNSRRQTNTVSRVTLSDSLLSAVTRARSPYKNS